MRVASVGHGFAPVLRGLETTIYHGVIEGTELQASHVGRQRRPTPARKERRTSERRARTLVCPSFFTGGAAAFAAACDASTSAACASELCVSVPLVVKSVNATAV